MPLDAPHPRPAEHAGGIVDLDGIDPVVFKTSPSAQRATVAHEGAGKPVQGFPLVMSNRSAGWEIPHQRSVSGLYFNYHESSSILCDDVGLA